MNEEMKRSIDVREKMSDKVDQTDSKWFGLEEG